ncbi:hypothetical protein D3C84_1090340 [compost metagenome]
MVAAEQEIALILYKAGWEIVLSCSRKLACQEIPLIHKQAIVVILFACTLIGPVVELAFIFQLILAAV